MTDAAPGIRSSPGGLRILRMGGPAAYLVAGVGVCALAAVRDPNTAGLYPMCPWLALTGTYCPGCGTLRALHALTHGDVVTALARNPLTVLASVLLIGGWLRYAGRMWRGQPRVLIAPAWLLYALAAALTAFWVLRNVPGWSWLSPA